MDAATITEFGAPEVIGLIPSDVPVPGPEQVRIKVASVGVNAMDVKIRSGAMQEMFPVELPVVLGLEAAGTVDAVGGSVVGVEVGDEVFGFADTGAYAEYVLMTTFAVKPASLDWALAAALPVAVETTMRVLDDLRVTRGDTLLIHGAAGNVGQIAVQVAVARGATVVGTAGPNNQEFVRSLGAVPLVYGEGLVDRVRDAAPQGVDAVFDVAGKGALPDSVELRGGTSRIVTIADPAAFALDIPFSTGGRHNAADLARAAKQAADGSLVVQVGRTFGIADAAAAHTAVETGHARGKTVLLLG